MKLTHKRIKKHTNRINPHVFNTVDSTNSIARTLAQGGAEEGTTIIAKKQTAGRGRLGRQFHSPSGGIYMSLLLRPKTASEDTLLITVAAAVAAAQAIEAASRKKCDIKWVNDIYIDGKKVCGILTEGGFSVDNALDYAILGVGINLFKPRGGFPEDIPLAGAIFDKSFRKNALRTRVIADFCNRFFAFYEKLQDKEYLKDYKNRSLLDGKEISYTKDGDTHIATVLGIDDNARLVVKQGEETVTISTGEVQIVSVENLFEDKK